MSVKELGTEWCLLQNQFDSYEKHSLYIKLISIIVLLAANIAGQINAFTLLILLVLWLQDAIWKTFQSRTETRLLQIENHIAEAGEESRGHSFQFNSEYHKIRRCGSSLVCEYARQSIRPTVAFPHVLLIFMLLVL